MGKPAADEILFVEFTNSGIRAFQVLICCELSNFHHREEKKEGIYKDFVREKVTIF